MIGRRKRSDERTAIRFADSPWNERSDEWQNFDRQVPADHLARSIVEMVKHLDLKPLYDSYLGTGSPPICPDLMLTIVLIEIRQGRPRPSQWFRDMRESIVLQWAAFGIRPSRSCWYEFAERVAPFLDQWNGEVIQEARREEVTPATRGSMDGSSMAANASRHRLLNETKVTERLAELENACPLETTAVPLTEAPSWMAKTARGRQQQRQRYERARQRLVELHAINNRQQQKDRRKPDKIVVSVSDVEAALGRDKQNVFRPLYNVQLVWDLDSPLYLGYQVFAQPTDAGTFGPMLDRVVHLTGIKLKIVLTDAGYVTACNLALCDEAGTVLYGPWQENDLSKEKKKEGKPRPLGKEHFTWVPEQNLYCCPEGHPMPWIGHEKRQQSDGQIHAVHSYRCAPQNCRTCPRQVSCSSNPNRGRVIKRSEHESLVEALRARMATPEGKSLYRLRRQTVELGYADLKEHRSLRQFTGRGRFRAQRQLALTVLVHNLLVLHRAIHPPGPPDDDAAATLTHAETTT